MNVFPSIYPSVSKNLLDSIDGSTAGIASGGGDGLPSGAFLKLYATDYQATPRRLIPNRATGVAVSQNLANLPSRMFSNNTHFGKASATCVDDASGSDSSLVGTGAWRCLFAGSATLPLGNYIVVAEVARNDASDQVFAFTIDTGTTRSSVKTATSSFVRHSFAFTVSGAKTVNQLGICSSNGSTGANLLLRSMSLYSGSVDLGEPEFAGHCYLGTSHYATQPEVVSNELDLSVGGYGNIQLPTALTVSGGFTQVAVIKETTSVNFNTILSKIQGYTQFSTTTSQNGTPNYFLGASVSHDRANLWKLWGKGFHVITHRFTGSYHELWIDDVKLHSIAGSLSSFALRDMNLGILLGAFPAKQKLNSIACWNRSLDDEELAIAQVILSDKAVDDGLTIAPQRFVCFEGDSITGADANTYPYIYGANTTVPFLGHNWAVSFSTMQGALSLTARQPIVNSAVPANKAGRKFILCVLIGANDLLSWPGASDTIAANAWADTLFTIADDYRTAGWELGLCTVLPKNNANYNARRTVANSRIRAAVGTHCDFVIDFDTDTELGIDTSYTTYPLNWTDDTHPSQAGRVRMEAIARPIIDAR